MSKRRLVGELRRDHHDIAAVPQEKEPCGKPRRRIWACKVSFRMNPLPLAVLTCLSLALAFSPACAQGATAVAAPAHAEEDGPLSALARTTGLRSKPVEAAEFVRNSRPGEMDFIPVHSKRPEAPGRLLTADELSAKEHELDALKARHDTIAKRKPAKVVYKPLQAPAQPKGAAPATSTVTPGVPAAR